MLINIRTCKFNRDSNLKEKANWMDFYKIYSQKIQKNRKRKIFISNHKKEKANWMDFCKKISQKIYKNRNTKIIRICNQNRDLKEQANWM